MHVLTEGSSRFEGRAKWLLNGPVCQTNTTTCGYSKIGKFVRVFQEINADNESFGKNRALSLKGETSFIPFAFHLR